MILMRKFLSALSIDEPLKILDVGSLRVGNAPVYKDIVIDLKTKREYTGLDIVAGPNVDLISLRSIFEDTYDVIISGQCLEHVQYPHTWIGDLYRILKSYGKICIITPSSGPPHHRPDYWRILPDGMQALLSYAGFMHVSVIRYNNKPWEDCIGVAEK